VPPAPWVKINRVVLKGPLVPTKGEMEV
jgi:hypothetical protein